MTYSILIVDDDADLARTIQLSLRAYPELSASSVLSGVDALRQVRRSRPDLIVLDIIMPGMDGYQVCSALRADPLYQDLPIVFLTAKSELSDRLEGFRRGADDYISKPFHIEELAMRIKAVLRRVEQQGNQESPQLVRVGDLELDCKSFTVRVGEGEKVLLTPVEFDLLHHLMTNAGTVFSCERLLQEVWGYPYDTGSPDLVRMHIRNLRQKIEEDPSHPKIVRTVPRYGYTIDAQPTEHLARN